MESENRFIYKGLLFPALSCLILLGIFFYRITSWSPRESSPLPNEAVSDPVFSNASSLLPPIHTNKKSQTGGLTTARDAQLATAQNYLAQAQFPPFSKPIFSPQGDPVLQGFFLYPHLAGPSNKKRRTYLPQNEPYLKVWTDQSDFVSTEPVSFFATLERGTSSSSSSSSSLSSATLEVSITQTRHKEPIARLHFEKTANRDSGASFYKAVWDPAQANPKDQEGAYTAIIKAYLPEGGLEYHLTVGFNLFTPSAKLAGGFRDHLQDGSLIVEAKVQVFHPGRFHLEGSLYSSNGQALVWSERAIQLEPGTHWIPLKFYGRALVQRGFSGPYRLRFLSLSQTGVMPNKKFGLTVDPYQTAHYSLNQFSNQPYHDSLLLRAAAELIEDLE